MKTKNSLFSRNLLCKIMLTLALVVGWNDAWGDTPYVNKLTFSNSSIPSGWSDRSDNSNYVVYSGDYITTSGNYNMVKLTSSDKINLVSGQKIVIVAQTTQNNNQGNFYGIKYQHGASTSGFSTTTGTLYDGTTNFPSTDTDCTITISISSNQNEYIAFWFYGRIKIKSIDFQSASGSGTPQPTNFSASSITYNSATLGWTEGGTESQWQVYYSTTEGEPDNYSGEPVNTKSVSLSELEAGETYYAYVRAYIDSDTQSDWVGTSFTTNPAPTEFTLDSFTGSTATFSWTNGTGSNPSAWQIQYSTDANFASGNSLQDGITTNPYTLSSGLTEGTKYYAHIRVDYGSDHYSDWSNKVEFIPSNDITINEGTNTNSYIPFSGYRANYDTKGQFIILNSNIETIENRQISKLTFYSNSDTKNWGKARFDVYVKESTTNSYSASALDNVYGTNVLNSAELEVVDGKMEINFDVPFNYTSGNNLLVTFKLNTKGNCNATYWYGISASNMSCYLYNNGTSNYSGRESFSPKMSISSIPVTTAPVKIGSTGYTTFSSPWALDLSDLPSGLKAYYVTAENVDTENSKIILTSVTEAVAAETGLLLKGTAGEIYEIPTTTSGTDLSSTNLLEGVCPVEEALTTDANKYVLVKNSTSGKAEFQSLADNGATITGGKAYLDITSLGVTPARLSVFFDDDEMTTGIRIKDVAQPVSNSTLYNLYGQKVDGSQRGIYIVNGKKYIK